MNEGSTPATERTKTAPFFVLSLGWTLTLQLPAVLARYGVIDHEVETLMPLVALGALGPAIFALVLARRQPGGARAVLSGLLRWRVSFVWYLVALLGLPIVYLAARAVYAPFADEGMAWLYPPDQPQYVIALFLFPIVEEIGWRGYALPRLQARYGAARASLYLGFLWAAWHTMMFLVTSDSSLIFAVCAANIVVGSFAFTWVHNRTRGSLLLAVLLHMGAHLNNPGRALPDLTPFVLQTVALVVVLAALFIADTRAWRPPYPKVPGT